MPKPPSPETVGSLFEYLFETSTITPLLLLWPPDAFCFAAEVLQRSAAYTELIGSEKPNINFKYERYKHGQRAEALEAVGEHWHIAAASGKTPPKPVRAWIKLIASSTDLPLMRLATKRRVLAAFLNLMAAADEASAGIGLSLTSADNDEFTKQAEWQLFPSDIGSSLCRCIHPSRARVLPKCHTPQSGLTIRSFSHFLSLVPSNEITPSWYSFSADTSNFALNLLLVPWPKQVTPKQFRHTKTWRITDEVEPGGYGLFGYDMSPPPGISFLKKILRTAEERVGRIDGVIFPELALDTKGLQRITTALVDENRFLVAGVGEPAQEERSGRNYTTFDVMLPGGEYVMHLEQSKHHRWKLDKGQILQYGLGATLHPGANWWEHISVWDRHLSFVTLRPWLTACVLICEDLARPDPLGDLVRAVGPNLIICLLMDGPQIVSRWPSRYATTLADDPGCSVLTLTSGGMSKMSKPPAGVPDRSECIALWKDSRTRTAAEITLPAGSDAVVLNVAVEYCEEWTADGRRDGGSAGHPYLAGQHPITL